VDVRITDFTHDLLTGDIEIVEADGAIWQINIPPAVAAPPPIGSSCINVTGSTISPIISPDACNGLECRANGLYAVRPRGVQDFTGTGDVIPAGTVIAPGAQVCSTTTTTITVDNTACPSDIGGHLQFGLGIVGVGAGSAPRMLYRRLLPPAPLSGPIGFGGGVTVSVGVMSNSDERDFFNIVVPGGTSTTYGVQLCISNSGSAPFTVTGSGQSIRYWFNVI
jgi:hypothetical protein